ncbi:MULTISPECIES: MFS transporter [unclassified Modestobacter]|uniref:MFS transporter n=1 Tax=unclassified Modestobacter TaxID=2643866 RepID=UPI0022AA8946|nr:MULTISPECIES: MFS transporter [unclassified Modestobacter]MCZ2824394.1 MFS transporter [Modestobacter sp. VKM Ac-2981]MCZ2854078.1 MFS transporter [Modestobacter sp. VKM Ac-2982]
MQRGGPAQPRGRAGTTALPFLLLAGVVLVALNLRGPLVAIAPVVDAMRADLQLSTGTIGLLTSIPVLCFGLAAPLASLLIARTGVHRAVVVSMAGVLAGTLLRSLGSPTAAIAGTVVMGLAITVGNVVVPVVIGRDFPGATNVVTAAYTAALNIGSTLTSALTAPLADLVGWQLALAAWGLLVVVAATVWTAALRQQVARTAAAEAAGTAPPPAPVEPGRSVWRQPAAWGLTLAFAGQAFSYYGATAWLPTLLADVNGMTRAAAGASSALFQVFAVVGAFAVPALVAWWKRPSLVLLAVTVVWAALPLGLLTAPSQWALWCSLAGIAQGGGITVVFIAIVRRSRDLTENRRLSAMVQGGGYVVAATGPLVIGTVHEASGGWSAPLLVILGSVIVMAVAGTASAGGRTENATEAGPVPVPAGKEHRG